MLRLHLCIHLALYLNVKTVERMCMLHVRCHAHLTRQPCVWVYLRVNCEHKGISRTAHVSQHSKFSKHP